MAHTGEEIDEQDMFSTETTQISPHSKMKEETEDVMHAVTLPREVVSGSGQSVSKGRFLEKRNEINSSDSQEHIHMESTTSKEMKVSDVYPEEHIFARVNCIEKIIICLDLSSEMDKPIFRARAGDKFSPLQLVKRALGLFVQSKHKLNKNHEYALVLLQDIAIWMVDFTNEPKEIITWLDDLIDTFECEQFDISSLYEIISKKVDLPQVEGDQTVIPPPFTVRALMIYGRSHCQLQFSKLDAFKFLDSSPYFFLDVFYIHEVPSEGNQCEEIYNSICDLDTNGLSYIFEASKNPTKLYDYMAQLLAHPLQRPLQNDSTYKIQLED